MKSKTVFLRVLFLTATPIIGLAGLLMAGEEWSPLFLTLAALPLAVGMAFVLMRATR